MPRLMALGPFRFSIGTAAYETLERSDTYRWEAQERIGRHPAMQFIGAGQTTVTLDGRVYPFNRGGLGQIETMRGVARAGAPQFLISGTGRIFGRFVVMSVDETQTYFFPNGAPRRQDFVLSLKSYGEDRGFA